MTDDGGRVRHKSARDQGGKDSPPAVKVFLPVRQIIRALDARKRRMISKASATEDTVLHSKYVDIADYYSRAASELRRALKLEETND